MNAATTNTNPIGNDLGVGTTLDPSAAPPLPPVAAAPAALSEGEAIDYKFCDEVVQRGRETFIEVGIALSKLRDGRLYRAEFKTFEDYCQSRLGTSARRARQIWSAAEVATRLSNAPGAARFQVPATEAQMRHLVPLPPEQQEEAWAEACRTAPNGKVTVKHVRLVVDRIVGKQNPHPQPLSHPMGEGGAGPEAEHNGRVPVMADRKVIEVAGRKAQDRQQMKLQAALKAISAARELESLLGTPDSAVAADVALGVQVFQKAFDHLKRTEEMQSSRS